jgi:hypothetical protein
MSSFLILMFSAEEYYYTLDKICSTLWKLNIPGFGLAIRHHLSHTMQLWIIHIVYLVW